MEMLSTTNFRMKETMMTRNVKTVLTVKQAAQVLGIGIRHVLTLLYENKLPGSYKLGLQWQIPEEAIKARTAARNG